jgi:hypothetical protein
VFTGDVLVMSALEEVLVLVAAEILDIFCEVVDRFCSFFLSLIIVVLDIFGGASSESDSIILLLRCDDRFLVGLAKLALETACGITSVE